tara:strand:+ start:40 stop:201 length:162 start_codon:yes stop_codon:yes gene_type:complete
MTIEETPLFAAWIAAEVPAGPAPTMTISAEITSLRLSMVLATWAETFYLVILA